MKTKKNNNTMENFQRIIVNHLFYLLLIKYEKKYSNNKTKTLKKWINRIDFIIEAAHEKRTKTPSTTFLSR
jgi:hypothetical protein